MRVNVKVQNRPTDSDGGRSRECKLRAYARGGSRLFTIFTPGGFDRYLAELATLTPAEPDDADVIRQLGERYDIWQG